VEFTLLLAFVLYFKINTLESIEQVFTVLMADDDIDDQVFLKMAIKKYSSNIKVKCFENGLELLKYLENHVKPNIIILDLNMPLKNGKETLKDIKTDDRFKHIPVLIYSTSKDPAEITSIYKLGGNSYISKFNNLKDLDKTIERMFSYWLTVVSLPEN
jgi:response regulator RpfG family c-di-GMP phosphodiesterase